MPDIITRSEYVEINNVPLATPAWEVIDHFQLWEPPPIRGADRLIPYSPGEQPLQRIYGAHWVPLPMLIYGAQDREGTPYGNNIRSGWRANFDVLVDELVDPEATAAPGTKLLRLHGPGDEIRSAQCHVQALTLGDMLGPATIRAVLDIVIPSGVLLVEGS